MNGQAELVYQYGYKYDSYENEEKPWFASYDKDKYEGITEEEYDEAQTNNESRYVKLVYTPLSKFEGAATPDKVENQSDRHFRRMSIRDGSYHTLSRDHRRR